MQPCGDRKRSPMACTNAGQHKMERAMFEFDDTEAPADWADKEDAQVAIHVALGKNYWSAEE